MLGRLPRWIIADQQRAAPAPAHEPELTSLQGALSGGAAPSGGVAPSPPASAPAPAPAAQVREQSELAKPIDWPTPLRYRGAACQGLFVYAVSMLEGAPRASAVSFATDASSASKFAHPGQKVGDWEVLSVTDDWSGANPSVWLIHAGEVCRARLTGNPARTPPPPPPPPRRRKRRRR
ncbi:MAG TPA: hypothetical protein VFS67_24120 [Polyangiaceae bacterium]|nr:hypothetical protein [Polyangiaceae bacterium]